MKQIFDHRRGLRHTAWSPTHTGPRSDVPLTVIENACNGIGDLLCYIWCLSSIRAANRPISITTHRFQEILDCFGFGGVTSKVSRAPIGRHPPKGLDPDKGWVRHWLDCFGHHDIPLVRPTFTPPPDDLAWANQVWADRPNATGQKILLFPEAAHKCRVWPESHYSALAWAFHHDGHAVITLGTTGGSNPYPYRFWGLPFTKWASLVYTADLVVGNDSGPIHLAGTLDRPSIAVLGPSPGARFFGHLSSVKCLSVPPERMPCVSCAWGTVRGKSFRTECDTLCQALNLLSPFEVLREADVLLKRQPRDDRLEPHPINGLAFHTRARYHFDRIIVDEVVRDNTYQIKPDPRHKTILDVGGHIGTFSVFARSLNPSASIAVVEPHPDNLPYLRSNCVPHNITVLEGAIAYRPGRLHSVIESGNPHANTGGSRMGGDGIEVPLLTIRDAVNRLGWSRINLLKLDCEGAEEQILTSPDLDLVDEVVGEYHTRSSFIPIIDKLQASGWIVTILREGILGLFHAIRRETSPPIIKNLTATTYDATYYEEHKAAGLDYLGHGDWQREYAAWILKYLSGPRILDLGCACGSVVWGFREHGADIHGIDLSEHMIGLGKAQWPEMADRLSVGDGADLSRWADGSFEVVHCAQVAEHFRPEMVPTILKEVSRVLKPGGHLFLCLDTTELYERQHRNLSTEDPTHICVKPRAWWEEELDKVGLSKDGTLESVMGGDPKAFCHRYDWDWMVFRKGTP